MNHLFLPKIYFLLLIFIIVSCNESTINKEETDFAVSDTALIDSIIITHSKTTTLSEQNGMWLVNNTFTADKKNIERLLNTIRLIKMNTPLPSNAVKNVKKSLKKGVLIQIFSEKERLKTYYLGKYIKNSGNYIMLKNADKPYIAHIPSYNFDLKKNFVNDLKYWQSTVLFNQKIKNIKQVFVKNYEKNGQFYLTKKENKFSLSKSKNTEIKNVKNEKILIYLKRYEKVEFEKFIYNYDKKFLDSLKNSNPIFEINLEQTNNKTINFKAYAIIKDNRKDKDKFIGLINEKDLILASYYDFDLLIKDYKYFLK